MKTTQIDLSQKKLRAQLWKRAFEQSKKAIKYFKEDFPKYKLNKRKSVQYQSGYEQGFYDGEYRNTFRHANALIRKDKEVDMAFGMIRSLYKDSRVAPWTPAQLQEALDVYFKTNDPNKAWLAKGFFEGVKWAEKLINERKYE